MTTRSNPNGNALVGGTRLTRAGAQLVHCPRCQALPGEPCQGRTRARVGNHRERRVQALALSA
jgi:hypothetical protein